jgi:hypothetical protein
MRDTDAIISHAQYPSNRFMSFYNCDLKKNKKIISYSFFITNFFKKKHFSEIYVKL